MISPAKDSDEELEELFKVSSKERNKWWTDTTKKLKNLKNVEEYTWNHWKSKVEQVIGPLVGPPLDKHMTEYRALSVQYSPNFSLSPIKINNIMIIRPTYS